MKFISLFNKENKKNENKEKLRKQCSINISVTPLVLQDIKTLLEKQNKSAVRILLSGFCWSGNKFEIVLDEQKEADFIIIKDEVKFVVNEKYKNIIGNIEIVKINNRITVQNSRY